ncbi:hypothetical protein ABC628_09830 [Lentilactobacillus otakiensis]|uniref:hypothetical protein n=1 Tax=Lentilactobacillus otakiensis TaxID=481720 RepID=UPI0031E34C0F
MENKKIIRHLFNDYSGVSSDEGGGDGPMNPKDFATKQELKDAKKDISHQIELLRADLKTDFANMDTKFANMETKIEKTRNQTIIWFVGTTLVVVGIVLTVVFKFLY